MERVCRNCAHCKTEKSLTMWDGEYTYSHFCDVSDQCIGMLDSGTCGAWKAKEEEEMELPFSDEKPPLGVKPVCLATESRIEDLTDAIMRQLEGGCFKDEYRQIKKYAKEIYLLADLVMQMESEE